MKHIILMLALLIVMPCISQNRRATSKTQKEVHAENAFAIYEGEFSDDIFGSLDFLGSLMNMEVEPNPLAQLKGKHAKLVISFNQLSEPQLSVYVENKKVLEESSSSIFEWIDKEKRLLCNGSKYALVVETKDKPYVALLGFAKNSRRVAHRWEIEPQSSDRTWFDIVIKSAHLGMSKLKMMEDALNGRQKKWTTVLADFEKAFPEAKNYQIVSKEEIIKQEVKDKLISAETMEELAQKGDIQAMVMLGEAYHEGKMHGIAKDERNAYKWLIKSYLRLENKKKQAVMDYIQNNLERRKKKATPHVDYSTLTEDRIDPLTLYQHPFATLTIPEAFDNGKKIAKKLMNLHHWTISQSERKFITIFGRTHNTLPSLYGERPSDFSWNKASKKHVNYSLSFNFNSIDRAEDFALHYAHDLFCEGYDFTEFSTSDDTHFSLIAVAPCTVNGKQYNLHNTIFCNHFVDRTTQKTIYYVNIEFRLMR